MNKKVRRATPADEPQIQKILQNRLRSMPLSEHAQLNWNSKTLNEELEAAQVWMIEVDQKAQAFLAFREGPDAYEITVLATDPSVERQGYQTLLLNQIKQLATTEKKQIWLEVHAQNQKALQFYKKNGLTITGTRKKYYSDGQDAILMSTEPK